MDVRHLPKSLQNMDSFSRREYAKAMSSAYSLSEPQIAYDLNKRLKSGEIVRQGWGQYSISSTKSLYNYEYSEITDKIADKLEKDYHELDFRIFEYVQLNEFMNHQMGRNTIFIFVENELMDYVFESLFEEYPGKVLLKPTLDDYYRYHQDDQVIVTRLASESPKGLTMDWHIRLEQMLVDMLIDKFVKKIIPESEKATIIENAFKSYLVDEKTMIRYARRKGAEKKLEEFLSGYRKAGII